MKKLIFFICLVFAIVSPKSIFSKGVNPSMIMSMTSSMKASMRSSADCTIQPKKIISIQNLINANIFFNENYTIFDADDDINDAERKFIPSSQKNSTNIISYLKEFHNPKLPKKFISNKNYFYLKNTLFIFISVFRI